MSNNSKNSDNSSSRRLADNHVGWGVQYYDKLLNEWLFLMFTVGEDIEESTKKCVLLRKLALPFEFRVYEMVREK